MAVNGPDAHSRKRRPGLRRTVHRLGKRARRRALYGFLCVALPLVRLLPWETGRALGRWLGEAAHLLARRERGLALDHLDLALGDRLSEADRRVACRRMFRGVGEGAAEYILALKRFGPGLLRSVDGAETRRQIRRLREAGKGLVILTGHLGNWELLAAWGGYLYPLNVVARRIYYEPFNRLLVGMRARVGVRTIYRSDSPRKLLRCLRRNEIVAILADQDVSDVRGVHVDFFGRPAYTPTGPVSLAIHSGAPILMASMIREGGRYRIISEPFDLVRASDREEELRLNTQRWSKRFEDLIATYPDQWPWYHRRWKTTPEILERKRREGRALRRPRR